MSVLDLVVCPICGAEYGLVRQTTKSAGSSQISYLCTECDSVLLWLGDDLWLQGDRWAYQQIGVADRSYLLHTSLSVDELRQLASRVPPAPISEAPVSNSWQASEHGWQAVPNEEGWSEERVAGFGEEAAALNGETWFEQPVVDSAGEAEVSAEYEWLEAQVSDSSTEEMETAGGSWPVESEPDQGGGSFDSAANVWPDASEDGQGGYGTVPAADEWTAEQPDVPAMDPVILVDDDSAGAGEVPVLQRPDPADKGGEGGAGTPSMRQRRSRGSPFLLVSVILTFMCLGCSAVAMIVSTNLTGSGSRNVLPASLPPAEAGPAETAILTSEPPATEPAAVEFQGVTSYVAATGSHYVVGEVLNTTDGNLRFLEVLASFYDGGGQLIGTGSTFAELSIIEPGGVAPFKLATLDPSPSLVDYKLRTDFLTTSLNPLGLEVVSHSASVADAGRHQITGEVRNPHDFPVKFPEIVATYYDPSHQVVRVEMAFGGLESLQPGEISPFEIVLVNPPADLQYYTLQTESIRE